MDPMGMVSKAHIHHDQDSLNTQGLGALSKNHPDTYPLDWLINRDSYTLQGINISHLGKRKIIFKMLFLGDMLVSWRVMIMVYYHPQILTRTWNLMALQLF